MMQAYASVQLNADLGLSDYVYGVGSGIFFLGYMVFQVRTRLAAFSSFLSCHPQGWCRSYIPEKGAWKTRQICPKYRPCSGAGKCATS